MKCTMCVVALLVALFVALPAVAGAQPDPTPVRSFRSFTRESAVGGLPQATVLGLHEDAQGVIWIATMGGVAFVQRGIVERLPELPNAPLDGAFNAFASRQSGGIYVGGNRGLWTWNGTAWSVFDSPSPLVSLAETASGRIVAVTTTGRLIIQGATSGVWDDVDRVAPFAYEVLTRSRSGQVIAAGQLGVVEVVEGVDVVERAEEGARPSIGRLICGASPPTRVRQVRVDASNTVWAGGDDGQLYYCTSGATRWVSIRIPGWTGSRIRSMTVDRRSRIWVGGDQGQVAFGSDTTAFTRWTPANGVKGATVTALQADRTGSLWLGFNGAGLQQWIGEAWSHRTFWETPTDTDSMFTFALSPTHDGGFLAAVFSRGVIKWDGRAIRTFGRAEGITEDIRCVVEPAPGVIWAGGRQALFESTDGRTFRQVHAMPYGFVNGIFQAPDGAWWAATSTGGVLRREGSRWTPVDAINALLPDPGVRHMMWRSNGDLWLATERGVVSVRADTLSPMGIVLPPALTYATVILERADGQMWVAGVGGIAVSDFDAEGSAWRMVTRDDGLPGRTIYAMAETPDGAVWVGGSAGTARWQNNHWTRFGVGDGLISEESNALGVLPRPNGDVLFGTMSGIAHFHADVQTLPPPPLAVYWRGEAAANGASVTVPADDRRLQLEWMAPWPRPELVTYRTRISRLNRDWSPPQTTPVLRVENLPTGQWTVEVAARVADDDADWTPSLLATVIVVPRWWETRWAMAGGLLALALAIAGLVRLRTQRLDRKANDLEHAVQEALASVKVLRGLLPICAHCKKIRDDRGYWRRLEDYIGQHSEADFSHSLCPDCQRTHYPEMGD